ncbi:putative ADP-ribose pyrophosphatase [Paenibacillus sp. 598K]|nr:putative ADP-ribose pyrophosphatase [Paenibacillus sp. 598K]
MNPPKHIVSAAAITINEKNELLLIKGPKRGWEMPGGQVEIGESLSHAAIRETEESGIVLSLTTRVIYECIQVKADGVRV